MDASSALTVVSCMAVSFFVGVLLARIFPDLQMEWGSVAEWVGSLSELTMAIIAFIALSSWRSQIRGASQHAAAADTSEAVSLTRYHFYDARNPMYSGGEFPDWYQGRGEHSTNDDAKAWAYLYRNRYQQLNEQMLHLARLRARATVLLSEEVANVLEQMARACLMLNIMFENKVSQIRQGEQITASRPDQAWIKRVDEAVAWTEQPPNDQFSKDFDAIYDRLIILLRDFM